MFSWPRISTSQSASLRLIVVQPSSYSHFNVNCAIHSGTSGMKKEEYERIIISIRTFYQMATVLAPHNQLLPGLLKLCLGAAARGEHLREVYPRLRCHSGLLWRSPNLLIRHASRKERLCEPGAHSSEAASQATWSPIGVSPCFSFRHKCRSPMIRFSTTKGCNIIRHMPVQLHDVCYVQTLCYVSDDWQFIWCASVRKSLSLATLSGCLQHLHE